MTSVIIGCPVRNRGWILKEWFSYVFDAVEKAGVEAQYLFVTDPSDEEDIEIIYNCDNSKILFFEEGPPAGEHAWTEDRYSHMVGLRNMLLDEVRKESPDYYLSLDSDILIHPECLANLIETTEHYDAVGGRTYMTAKGTHTVSWISSMTNGGGGMFRDDWDNVRIVDGIMAIKLMTPTAYVINYQHHFLGEDVGWSLACKANRLKMAGDGRVVSKHVMHPSMLNEVDKRCGY